MWVQYRNNSSGIRGNLQGSLSEILSIQTKQHYIDVLQGLYENLQQWNGNEVFVFTVHLLILQISPPSFLPLLEVSSNFQRLL
jgi:hypothetical protein